MMAKPREKISFSVKFSKVCQVVSIESAQVLTDLSRFHLSTGFWKGHRIFPYYQPH